MKKFKLFVLLAFMGLATSASAQFVNPSSSGNSDSRRSNSSFDFTSVKTDGWNRIYLSYIPSKMGDGDDNVKFKGFAVGWLKGTGLTQKMPLFLEAGIGIQYRTYKEDDDEYSDKWNLLSLNIPVNLLYRFSITDDFSVSPYFGIDFRVNVIGKNKWEYTYRGETVSSDYNLFSKDDMGNDDTWNRFQAGWHIGIGFDYRAIHLGIDYGKDFNEIAHEVKISTTSITLGFNF